MKRMLAAWSLCLLLTGCWDQIHLKNQLFVDVLGVDYEGDNKRLKVSFLISALREANQGGGKPSGLLVSGTGVNLYDAVMNVNTEMPGILTALETRLYLISDKFAKDQPLNYLDTAGQFSANPLYAHLAMYDGDLSKLLAKKKINDKITSDYLVGLLDDQKKRGRIPPNKVIHYILGGTKFINDFALNRLEPAGDGARLAGTALFRDGKYTGVNLNNEDTLLYCLMDGVPSKEQPLTGQIDGKNYTLLVKKAKRDFQIHADDKGVREIDVSLKFDLRLVVEGVAIRKHKEKQLAELEKAVEADIRKKSANVIAILQKANCDGLEFGHEIAAYHPELYKKMNWREEYPKLTIKPKVKIRILNTGILD